MNRIAILPFVLCGGFLFACCASGGEKDSGVENIAGVDAGVCSGVDGRCPGPVKPNIQGCLIGPHSLKAQEDKGACPDDMVLIDGDYCPVVEEICLYCVDANMNKVKCNGITDRCGEFKKPTRCLSSAKTHKRFCIDEFEIPNIEGQIPTSWLSYTDAENFCKSKGKRITTSSEWELACEGPDMKPYPYFDGYHRADRTICNTDNPPNIDVFKATTHNTATAKALDAMLVPSGSRKDCVSDYGVMDQIGNLDEFVYNETGVGYISGLKGGHIWGVRARCRPMTTAHNGVATKGGGFSWYETSGRCSKDAAF